MKFIDFIFFLCIFLLVFLTKEKKIPVGLVGSSIQNKIQKKKKNFTKTL